MLAIDKKILSLKTIDFVLDTHSKMIIWDSDLIESVILLIIVLCFLITLFVLLFLGILTIFFGFCLFGLYLLELHSTLLLLLFCGFLST